MELSAKSVGKEWYYSDVAGSWACGRSLTTPEFSFDLNLGRARNLHSRDSESYLQKRPRRTGTAKLLRKEAIGQEKSGA